MKAEYLVIDSGPLLKNANIKDLGSVIYTCFDVVSEIRDRATRRRLSVLPFELKFKEPSPDAIQKIVEVSKVTGDYRSLSKTDIKVLALTYELSRLHGNTEINENIKEKTDTIQIGGDLKSDLKIPGFYIPSKYQEVDDANEKDDVETDFNVDAGNNEVIEKEMSDIKLEESATAEDDESSDNSDNCSEEDDDGMDGWITPAMLRQMKNRNAEEIESQDIKVACITTDFAMQNVLKKMNLQMFSVDGMLIKSLRSYVLRCHACFEVTKIMTKLFCPKCGNKTLKRVPVELNPDGTMKLFFSRNPKVLNPRGLQYSLPKPQGGKHAQNPILVEDQRIPQNRPSRKALQKTNVWSDDYENSASPFALNDTQSKAFRLGIRPGSDRNKRTNGRFIKRR